MSESFRPTPYADGNAVLAYFHRQLSEQLGDGLRGMYVVGSLALGDFDPQHSDIDILVVTDADAFTIIQQIHADFDASGSPWAAKVEAVYPPPNALRSHDPTTQPFPQIEKGTPLFMGPPENGWVFQCYTLREHGLIIAGPDPRTLVAPTNRHDMRSAVAVIAGLWFEQAHHDPSWLDWVRDRSAQVFVIQTLCRMLYSLATGAVVSKPKATQWAASHLDEQWASLITTTLARQTISEAIQPHELDGTVAFVQYTLEQSQR